MASKLFTTVIILICIYDTFQQAVLSITPKNKAAVLGSNVTFQCQVTQNDALTDYISWEECITTNNGTCRRISNDDIIVYSDLGGNPQRGARYFVAAGLVDIKQIDLTISGILSEDAGQYRCLSRNAAHVFFSGELVVLESEPVCDHVCTDDIVTMSCEVDYYGKQAPVVEFSIEGDDIPPDSEIINTTVSGSTGGHMVYNITFQPRTNDKGRNVYATTKFTSFPAGDRIASNAPVYEYKVSCLIPGGATNTTTRADSGVLTTGAIIGIAVGGVALVTVIIVIIVCVYKQKNTKQGDNGERTQPIALSPQGIGTSQDQANPSFLSDEDNTSTGKANLNKHGQEELNYADLDLQCSSGPNPPNPPRVGNDVEPTMYADIQTNLSHNPNQKNVEGLAHADLDLLQHANMK